MDQIIDFILENYIWFIIGITVVVMTIVGYIVDKNNFGVHPEDESNEKPKKEKKKKEKKGEVVEIENKGLNDLTNNQPKVEEVSTEATEAKEVAEEDDLYAPLSQEVTSELGVEQLDESIFQPLNESIVNETVEQEPVNEVVETAMTPDMSFNETSNQLVENVQSIEEVENAGDNIVSEPVVEIKTETNEEDVWKF